MGHRDVGNRIGVWFSGDCRGGTGYTRNGIRAAGSMVWNDFWFRCNGGGAFAGIGGAGGNRYYLPFCQSMGRDGYDRRRTGLRMYRNPVFDAYCGYGGDPDTGHIQRNWVIIPFIQKKTGKSYSQIEGRTAQNEKIYERLCNNCTCVWSGWMCAGHGRRNAGRQDHSLTGGGIRDQRECQIKFQQLVELENGCLGRSVWGKLWRLF